MKGMDYFGKRYDALKKLGEKGYGYESTEMKEESESDKDKSKRNLVWSKNLNTKFSDVRPKKVGFKMRGELI